MKEYKNIQNRNYLVDNLKVILIFAVVFGHTIEYYINQNDILRGAYIYIYIFHMPLFVFISGYLSKKSTKSNEDIVRKLLIPYIFFNTLWYIGVYLATGINMFSIVYPGWTLWYLISLFFWRLSLKYITNIKFIIPISFILGLLIGLDKMGEDFLSLSRTIVFLPFFLIGYYTNETYFKKINNINKGIGSFIVIIFIIIAMYIAKYEIIDYKFLYNSHAYDTNNLSVLEGIISRIILYISSIILSVGVISLMPSKKVFYSKYGKNTMNVYVFHIYVIVIVLGIIPRWDINLISNIIILISPVIIFAILSLEFVKKIYDFIFNPINNIFGYILNLIKSLYYKIVKI